MKTKFFVSAGLVLLSAVFLLTALEISLRLYDLYLDRRFPEQVWGSQLYEADPLLGWRGKADFTTYYSRRADRFRNQIKTNSKGLRDGEYAYEKPEHTTRILLLGDSVPAGLEVAREALLDVKLEALFGGGYEVINTGVQAYGTDQQLLYLKEEGRKYAPDIIIHIAVFNDPTENITIHQRGRPFGKSYFRLDDTGALVLNGIPIPPFESTDSWVMSLKEAEQYRNILGQPGPEVKQNLPRLFIYQWFSERCKNTPWIRNLLIRWRRIPSGEPDPGKPQTVKIHERLMHFKLLEAMSSFAGSLNAKFMVYEFTNGQGKPPDAPTDVQMMCTKLGIPYHNSFELFFNGSRGGPVYSYRYDGHWNAKGHQLAAESIHRFLVDQGWAET